MDRREFIKRSGLTGASFAIGPIAKLSTRGTPNIGPGQNVPQLPLGPAQNCLWGAFAKPMQQQNALESLLILEAKVGRKFGLHRNYQGMDSDILTEDVDWLTSRGTACYRSFHAWLGDGKTPIPWAAIAAGEWDTWIKKQASDLASWGKPMYITFHHEPEVAPCGTPAQYKAAFIHVRSLFGAATKLTWLATLLSPTYAGHNGGPATWLPPTLLFDVLGVDGYNRYPCEGRYSSFSKKFLLAMEYAGKINKPLAIGEWGSVEQNSCDHPEGDPLGKAKWIDDSVSIMKQWDSLIWVSYTHEKSGPYTFWVDSSPSSLKSFVTGGYDPYFK